MGQEDSLRTDQKGFIENENNENIEFAKTVRLNGPRVGITYIAPGELASELKDEYDINPFITQFGWQFEKKYFSNPNGISGLVEGILLIGGLEQNTFLPSANLLIGIRNSKGIEFGFGPNVSPAGAAFVLAAGFTIQSNGINFPINFALVPSNTGFRYSILIGFNSAAPQKTINERSGAFGKTHYLQNAN